MEHKEQPALFDDMDSENKDMIDIGGYLSLEFIGKFKTTVSAYRNGVLIKTANLLDKIEKRLFIIDMMESGASPGRLASALDISRQTIHNYMETKKYFGMEGVIQGYSPAKSKSRRKQRKENHSNGGVEGNKAQLVAQLRKNERDARKQKQRQFKFNYDQEAASTISQKDQPFAEEHDWEPSRYAGVFSYIIALITEWRWLELVMGYFGVDYKIFMVFLLMVVKNIGSIESLKNVRCREAGIVLGIKRIGSRPKIWEWFYNAAEKKLSLKLLKDYFRYQILSGLVGLWLWFTDGHLLPYTGKEKVRSAYSTQRRMPYPGQTNMVTCDSEGRVVYFEIQEGKGDLREHVIDVAEKWFDDLPQRPVMVFDREGSGVEFFSKLVKKQIPFVTWEKGVDKEELDSLSDDRFIEDFEFNGKKYSIFEEEESFIYKPDSVDKDNHEFTLRRIYIWNRSSNRRACGLAWCGGGSREFDLQMSTSDCAFGILSRWGASENTFKHIKNRHPYHYHPGFKFVESKNQEIMNPAIKKKQKQIDQLKRDLNKLYKKLSKSQERLTQNGKPRKNSVRKGLEDKIARYESELGILKKEKSELPQKVDVSTMEDYRSFRKLDNEGKYLFDFVTSSVWNARKEMVDWMRPFFPHENELVDLFYAICDCHGWVKSTATEVIVRLEPLEQPKRLLAQEQLCRKLNSLNAQLPCGKWLSIEVGESPLKKK